MGTTPALFNIGDIVRLKSGGPPMTVVQLPAVDLPSLPPLPGDDQIVCKWFEGKRHHQKSFPAEALKAAPDAYLGVALIRSKMPWLSARAFVSLQSYFAAFF